MTRPTLKNAINLAGKLEKHLGKLNLYLAGTPAEIKLALERELLKQDVERFRATGVLPQEVAPPC